MSEVKYELLTHFGYVMGVSGLCGLITWIMLNSFVSGAVLGFILSSFISTIKLTLELEKLKGAKK